MKLFAAAACLLVLINAAGVAESRPVANNTSVERRHGHGHHDHGGHHHSDDNDKKRSMRKLFVFGDELADNGNVDSDPALGLGSRVWRYPYGMSDTLHGRKSTGRMSDGLVQSDFLAMIMGHRESPPAYSSDDWDDDAIDPSGINFAVAGARALDPTSAGLVTLRKQVQQLRDLVRDGVVDEDRDFKDSVALVAYSGNDYGDAGDDDASAAMMPKVVSELASVVSELQDIGVSKVMVNTLQPFGCSAWQAKRRNYESCNDDGNALSDKHNTELRDRLGDDDDDVMLLDLNSVFMDMVAPRQEGSTLAAQFTERLRPCCEGVGDDGYCGLDQQFTLCDRPDQYFYWDDFYPTHAGWRAVMRILQGPIMAFLGISTLNHF